MRHSFLILIASFTFVSLWTFTSCNDEPCDCTKKVAKTLVLNSAATIIDSEIWSKMPTVARYNVTQLGVAYWTWSGIEDEMKTMYQFDLSSISPEAEIKSAVLILQETNTVLSPSDATSIYKITQAWDQTLATWNNPPIYDTTVVIHTPKDLNDSNMVTIHDISLYVKEWVKNPATNFGIILQITDQSLYHGYSFYAIEETDTTKRPKLVIEYEE